MLVSQVALIEIRLTVNPKVNEWSIVLFNLKIAMNLTGIPDVS